jgi:hypothetical protein
MGGSGNVWGEAAAQLGMNVKEQNQASVQIKGRSATFRRSYPSTGELHELGGVAGRLSVEPLDGAAGDQNTLAPQSGRSGGRP